MNAPIRRRCITAATIAIYSDPTMLEKHGTKLALRLIRTTVSSSMPPSFRCRANRAFFTSVHTAFGLAQTKADTGCQCQGTSLGAASATISGAWLWPRARSIPFTVGTSDGRRPGFDRRGPYVVIGICYFRNRFVTSIAVHPLVSETVLFVGLSGFGTGHIFRTDSSGATWTDIRREFARRPGQLRCLLML